MDLSRCRYAQPLKTHPYSAVLGDKLVNCKWERRHKFSDFGCTVCHDGQGRGLETHYSHGEDHFWPDPLAGYVVQANWRKEFQPKLKGKLYLEANCAQCHTEEDFAGTPNVDRGGSCSSRTTATAATRSKGCLTARWRRTLPRWVRSSRWITCGSPSWIREPT